MNVIRNRKTVTTLFGITFLGLLLRLWGAGHGLGDELFTHPDEIPFADEVKRFSKGYFSIPFWKFSPLWTYLNTLGVYLYSLLEGILKYPFGVRHSFIEIPDTFRIVLIGRLLAGIIGAMTIPVLYLIGKRLFNEKTGIVGAGIMAVLYLHVRQSHYAYVDVPQTFFLTLSFYFMVKVALGEMTPNQVRGNSFLAGIFLALAIATKINAAPGFVSLILAHYHNSSTPIPSLVRGNTEGSQRGEGGLLRGIKKLIKSKYLYISFMGLIIGYGLCTPWYWVRPMSFIHAIRGLLNLLYGNFGHPFDVIGGIKNLSGISFGTIGLPFILLLILILIFTKKDWKVFFVLSFPLAYLPFFLLAAWQDERELVPVIPFLVIVMAYGIYRMAEIISFKRKGAIMLFLSLFFILPSLWVCLKADYFLWQKDTRVLASEWIKENLPWNARIGMEGYSNYNIPIYYERYEINSEFSKLPIEEAKKHIDFIIVSSIIYDSLDPEKKRYYDSIREKSRLIKVFSTVQSYFFNPKIEIYRLSPKGSSTRQGEASASIIPRTYSERDSYALSFGEGVYGKEPLSFWIWPGTTVKRVLISERKLKTIGIFIYNGSGKTDLKIKTTFNRKKIALDPYERRVILLNPSLSFPFIKYIYNISIGCGKEGGAFVSILTDPKRIVNALLEVGDWEGAIGILSNDGLKDKEGRSLLGLAYSMGRRYKEALEAFRNGLSPSRKELLSEKEWTRTFEKFTNIDSAFLRDSLTVNYNIDQFFQQTGRKMGWIAHFDPRFDRSGFLLFGLYKKFPKGHFKAIFKIRVIGSGKSPAARIDVFNGEVTLAEKIIKDTKGKVEEFSLNFYNDEPDRPIEFRVEALGGRELWAEEIKVLPDIYNQYKKFFGKVHHYWGLSAGNSGLREEAIEHFEIAELLGYNDTEGLYQMAKVYEKMGMKEKAIGTYKRVIDAIPNHIDSLLALKQVQGLASQGTLLEGRIKSLTPKYEIRQGFGDFIEFIGYSIGRKFESPSPRSSPLGGEGSEGAVFKVHPGEEFSISYFWRTLEKLRSNYSIFVHFRKDDITVFQNDYSPSLKTNKWKTGEVVREDYTIKVPSSAPVGKYDIIIGVWDPEGSKERLRLKGRSIEELRIGSIVVY